MQDQDIINEEERHEAATETPIGESKSEVEVEERNVPLAHFPSGADGTEPGGEPDYEMLARELTRDGFDSERLAKAIEALASEKPVDYPTFYTPGWLCEIAKWLQGKGTKPGDSDGYEKFMTLPNGSRLVRFHGSNTIRLLSSRKGKSGNPNNVFEIEVNKDNKTAYIRRDDTPLFSVEGATVGYNVVESLAVSALKRYMKDRMADNARHKRRRAAKRRAANQELVNKELA